MPAFGGRGTKKKTCERRVCVALERRDDADASCWAPDDEAAAEEEATAAAPAEAGVDEALEGRVLEWHVANLEYGCSAPVHAVSAAHWDQDDAFATDGAHFWLEGGFGRLAAELARDVDVVTGWPVARISYEAGGGGGGGGGGGVRSSFDDAPIYDAAEEVEHVLTVAAEPIDGAATEEVEVSVTLDGASAAALMPPPPPPPAGRCYRTGEGGVYRYDPSVGASVWVTPPPPAAGVGGGSSDGGAEAAASDGGSGPSSPRSEAGDGEGGASAVRVEASDGRALSAEFVCVTVPLGVLKADTVAFSPPLPRAKAEAIRRLGFGTIVKVVMAFAPSDVFWDDRPDFLGGVAAEGEARGAFFLYVNAQRTDGVRPAVLVAICSGDAAAALDGGADDGGGGDDDELARAALAKLHRMRTRGAAPAPPPRRPLHVVVRRWGREPAARGAYSSVARGGSGEDYDALAAPVGGRLFFAGEHTSRKQPASVTGAVLSGLREACRIDEAWQAARGRTSQELADEWEAHEAAWLAQ